MTFTLPELLLAIGAGSVLTAIVRGLFTRRKTSADAVSVLSKAAAGMVQPLEEQIARCQTKLTAAESEVDRLRGKVRDLSTQLDASESDRALKSTEILRQKQEILELNRRLAVYERR